MTPSVSILLPVYNAAAYLEEALESLRGQTLADFELLAVDDGSTDASADLLARYARRDPRLRVIRHEQRRRLSGALNRALDEARGEWVARMDADDRAHPRRLERQCDFLRAHPDLAFCGTGIRRFGRGRSGRLRYPAEPETMRAFALFDTPICHPTAMWRRAAFESAGLRYDGSFYPAEDFDWWVRVMARFRGANLGQVLLDYRLHGASMTGAEWTQMDAQAVRISARQLAEIGVSATEADLRRHRDIALHRPAATEEALAEHGRWLHAIAEANRAARRYAPEALDAVLRDLWWQSCMNSTALGRAVWRVYRASGWRAPARRHEWLLRASVIRRGRRR